MGVVVNRGIFSSLVLNTKSAFEYTGITVVPIALDYVATVCMFDMRIGVVVFNIFINIIIFDALIGTVAFDASVTRVVVVALLTCNLIVPGSQLLLLLLLIHQRLVDLA